MEAVDILYRENSTFGVITSWSGRSGQYFACDQRVGLGQRRWTGGEMTSLVHVVCSAVFIAIHAHLQTPCVTYRRRTYTATVCVNCQVCRRQTETVQFHIPQCHRNPVWNSVPSALRHSSSLFNTFGWRPKTCLSRRIWAPSGAAAPLWC